MKKILLLFGLSLFLAGFVYGQTPLVEKKVENNSQNYEMESPVVHPTFVKTARAFAISEPLQNHVSSVTESDGKTPWIGREKRKIKPDNEIPDFDNLPLDPNVQTKLNTSNGSKGLIHNYSGQTSGSYPPDCNGEVGIDHFFQTVNVTYAIYLKATGAMVANGDLNDIFNPALPGAGCNNGDPIVLWDEQAQRWFYAEFSLCTSNDLMLIAVSDGPNPVTSSWYSWSFDVADMPDYMKFGIWEDGYYMSTNTSSSTDVYVFERTAMLAGDPSAQMIAFDNPNRPSTFDGFHAIMPLDNDGPWAPTGTPGGFITIADGDEGNPGDELWIYECVPDWTTPSNSTFQRTQTLSVNPFVLDFNGSWDNIPQPGTTAKLDAISTVLMFRTQYRNFSGKETIVAAHTIAETSTEGAIRWYILERNGGLWSIAQQSTYNPGGTNGTSYWLPGISMNGAGQLAMGYNISSNTNGISPGIRIVGRSQCAPANTMDMSELLVATGGASQTAANRWGDYASMAVDPVDDYTFWFTTEFLNSSGSTKETRIVAYQVDAACDPPDATGISPTSLYEDRGKQLTITGTDLIGCTFTIGGIAGSVVSNDGSTAVVTFPAGNYTNGTLVVSNGTDTDSDQSITINTRNTIPVVSGSSATSDNHPTILSAVNGLHAWYGTTAFNAGDLAGTKTIDVYAGTYTDEVSLNTELNPTAANPLIIQNHSGDVVLVNASGNNYGFDLSTVDYVQLKGFSIHSADIANIYVQGTNCEIAYNELYDGSMADGIRLENGGTNDIHNNLIYNNERYAVHVINSTNNNVQNNTTSANGGVYAPLQNVELWNEGFETGAVGWTLNSPWAIYTGVPHTGTSYLAALKNSSNTTAIGPSVSISGYNNIEISFWYYCTGNDATDHLRCFYNVDGAGDVQFFDITGSQTGYTYFNYSLPVTGNNVVLTFQTNNGNSEYSRVDDIIIIGDENVVGGNLGSELYVESGTGTTVENNIFYAKNGTDYYTVQTAAGVTVSSDYNTYFANGNSNLFNYNGTVGNAGPMGANDITTDPDFVNAGTDFHIKSTAGSYAGGEWPPLTASSGSWTLDGSDSPAIDAGNTADAFGNEPASNGGVINQGAYGNTLQASKSPAVVAAHNWTGNVSTDWQTAGNWDLGTIPTATDNVVIPNGRPRYPVIDDGTTTALCDDISIESSASLTIATNGEMTVAGAITNAAGTSGLVIQSDATGTGSLIQNSVAGVNATVQQLLAASGRAWHMMGAPISNATVAVFPSTTYLYYYDESIDDYWTGTVYDSPVNGWTNYTAGGLNPTTGYLYNDFQTTIDFAGSLNTSTSGSGIAIDYTNSGLTSANGSTYQNYDGWNLVSNPFTSAIDWTVVNAASANLYDAIYTW
ncbi:MAG: hypothetical protein JXR36_05285, partial [Bacteroidales bacterium]|nr:hypothetical protein [Bacteroidales bacterium]